MFFSFNLQYLRYQRRRVVKFGVFCICLVKRMRNLVWNAKLAVLSDLVSGYGENFLAQEFFIGIDILRV